MKPHLQTLIDLLTSRDLLENNNFDALLAHYLSSSEAENIAQLAFIFQQGQKSLIKFGFYQNIATKFIDKKGLPIALITEFKSTELLSFFTPALQLNDNFKKTNSQQANVLHYLLAGEQKRVIHSEPPFNYLRSMTLFERNEALCNALCQRDQQNLTPVEVYLSSNKNLAALSNHELSASFALIEIEHKQQTVDETNYQWVIKNFSALCQSQVQPINSELQRVLLIATYYKKPIKQVVWDID